MASDTVGVWYSTFKKWKNELDPWNTWLRCEENAGNVTSVYCELCRKSETSLRELCNFNTPFINGIKDSALKKDNSVKHAKSEIHKNALHILNKPPSIQEFFVKIPVGKIMSSVSETKQHIGKLVGITYVLDQEETAFNKFPKLVELEKRPVDIGETYATLPKCDEFTSCIATTLKNELINNLRNSNYLTICCDGSTYANFGHIHGLCPWLLAIHCLNHRLELSVKYYIQSTYLINVLKILGEVHEFYSKSPKPAMVLGEGNATSVPTSRVQGVRWVPHKKKCLDVLVRNYNVIVSQLGNLATGNKSQSAKLSGVVKTMKSAKFVAMTDGHFGDTLSELLKPKAEMEEDGGLTYQGISLSLCSSIEIFNDSYNGILTQLHYVVHKRFSDLYENNLIKFGIKILLDKMWSTDEKTYAFMVMKKSIFLCTHYKEVLEEKGITADSVCEEWKDFKTF
ncbi:hypothetical protein PR048_024668 [Dryococelus australis]|uniref:DUF659 domain-containing protein n=1 Tax=Dryococelus australis TaxID=614101 RepID=A0ABQ9GPA4_9NEOP|nr:hypothetical protein PR048_024668 [Dryococelus australis]